MRRLMRCCPAANPAYFRAVLRPYVPLQLALIATGVYAAVNADWPVVLGIAFSVGFITGSQGITFAHELGHSKSKIDRFCAWVLMTRVCYGHFMVEYYLGHHPRAATQADPATARHGESLYHFLPRSVWCSWVSGWQLEAQRLAQFKQFEQRWWRSPLVWSSALSLMLFVPEALYLPTQAAIKLIAFLVAISHCVGAAGDRQLHRALWVAAPACRRHRQPQIRTLRHDARVERRPCRIQQHAGQPAAPFRPPHARVEALPHAGAIARPAIADRLRRLHFAGDAAAAVVCGDAPAS